MAVLSLTNTANKYGLFSWSKQKGISRNVVARAKDAFFWDETGKKYLDFSSQLVNTNLGHSHPRLKKAIQKQLNVLDYAAPPFISKPKVELARQICELTGLGKVLFTTGGGEANENAILIARQFSGKNIILSRDQSYHGATYGARTASRDSTRNFPNKFNAPYFKYFSTPTCISPDNKDHRLCCETSIKELKKLS